jgi:glycerol kinase
MAYLLALDQGTTSSRAIVFDPKGTVISLAQKEFKQFFPSPGWVEHDAEEIWSTQYAVANEALARAHLRPREIGAIGITNQRETTVLWDRATSRPLGPAIVWQDRRTAPLCDELRQLGVEDAVREKTGLLLDPYFSATKLSWLLDHIPGARARAERGELAFGTIDSWLVWKLTDGKLHITDPSNASRTLLYNLSLRNWDPELLALFRIPPSLLPEVRSSSERYGTTDSHIFSNPICLSGIAGDQQAALFGQGCSKPGLAKATYGTGCFLLMNIGTLPVISPHRLLTTVAWSLQGKMTYAMEGSVFIAGAAIQWLRDNLGLIRESKEIDLLAGSVPDSGGVCFVPAFTGLGAPYWDPSARGALLGLTRGTEKGHIARAALEAIAFSAADVLSAMEKAAGSKLKELRVDGGASASDLMMQFQADLSRVPVLRPKTRELTAFGAAMLAGIAAGVVDSPKAVSAGWELERSFLPANPIDDASKRRWEKAIERAKGWSL